MGEGGDCAELSMLRGFATTNHEGTVDSVRGQPSARVIPDLTIVTRIPRTRADRSVRQQVTVPVAALQSVFCGLLAVNPLGHTTRAFHRTEPQTNHLKLRNTGGKASTARGGPLSSAVSASKLLDLESSARRVGREWGRPRLRGLRLRAARSADSSAYPPRQGRNLGNTRGTCRRYSR